MLEAPPVRMCTVRRQFIGSWGCGNSGRSFVCFRRGALPAAPTRLPLGGSTWYQVLLYCLLDTQFQKRSERPGEALSQLTDIETIISVERRLNKSQYCSANTVSSHQMDSFGPPCSDDSAHVEEELDSFGEKR